MRDSFRRFAGAQMVLVFLLSGSAALASDIERIYLTIRAEDEGYERENLHRPAARVPVINPIVRHVFKGARLRVNQGEWTDVEEMKTHGQHCLTAFRKCFSIGLEDAARMRSSQGAPMDLRHFNLVSMEEDRGLSTLDLGFGIYREMGLLPLKGNYVELIVNGRSRGPYYAVESPEHYLKETVGSPFAGRGSGLFNRFKTEYFDEKAAPLPEADYVRAHADIVTLAGKLGGRGTALYDELKRRMDIDKYLEYLALNSILMNGDYADEVFFFAAPGREGRTPYFDVMAWDTDALFKKPHWFPQNTVLWRRRIRKTLFYSMESKLDRRLSRDPYIERLLARDIQELLTGTFTPAFIESHFEDTRNRLLPYASDERVMAPTARDPGRKGAPYSRTEILERLEDKRRVLMGRRAYLLERTRVVRDEGAPSVGSTGLPAAPAERP